MQHLASVVPKLSCLVSFCNFVNVRSDAGYDIFVQISRFKVNHSHKTDYLLLIEGRYATYI